MQKLSPRDKSVRSIQSYDKDSKPHHGGCAIKIWRITELKQFHSFTLGQALFLFFFFSFSPCPCCHQHVHFFIHNSSFWTSSDSARLPKVVLHNAGEVSYIFTSSEWMMTLCCNAILGSGEIPASCPLLGFTVYLSLMRTHTLWNTISLTYSICAAMCIHRHTKFRKSAGCQFLLY